MPRSSACWGARRRKDVCEEPSVYTNHLSYCWWWRGTQTASLMNSGSSMPVKSVCRNESDASLTSAKSWLSKPVNTLCCPEASVVAALGRRGRSSHCSTSRDGHAVLARGSCSAMACFGMVLQKLIRMSPQVRCSVFKTTARGYPRESKRLIISMGLRLLCWVWRMHPCSSQASSLQNM